MAPTTNTANYGNAITFGARDSNPTTSAFAGIYVRSGGGFGTTMVLATSDSYAVGSKAAVLIDAGGITTFLRARPTYAGNTILDAGNYNSYAMQGAGYSANQNLNTTNSPTFAGITLSGPIYRSGAATGYLNGGYASQETASTTGAIYTIGGSYVPTSTSLNNMYGIGYTNISANVSMTNASGWGMYVAANGTPYVWLGADGNPSVFRGNILPHATNTYNLGSSSYTWANIYTGDLHLSNETKENGNDIDGTKGSWTIQEGEENLFIINNKTGKKFKFKLEEIE